MTQAANKVQWCLTKTQKELKEGKKHRGLLVVKPNQEGAKAHIRKAEHYFQATQYLKDGKFTDVCASTLFYTMYHSLLAIAAKFGYESRNQECTIALMYTLIEEKKISLSENMLHKISSLQIEEASEKESLQVRELYQYGTALSMSDNLYKELMTTAQDVLSTAKEIIEE